MASPRFRPAEAVMLVFFVLMGATMLRRQFTGLRAYGVMIGANPLRTSASEAFTWTSLGGPLSNLP